MVARRLRAGSAASGQLAQARGPTATMAESSSSHGPQGGPMRVLIDPDSHLLSSNVNACACAARSTYVGPDVELVGLALEWSAKLYGRKKARVPPSHAGRFG